MDPIAPTSHRRRRSSLMAPSTDPFSHPRAQSVRNTGGSPQDEPKILEEDADDETSALRPDRRGDDLSDEDLHDDEETGLTSKERRRKRQKRRRNTMLDQRIVREKLTTEERKVADQNVARQVLINCSLIGLWYLFSLSISLYNKWMFDGTRLNFPFPLFTTAVHMLVQFLLASLVLYFIPSLRPHNGHRSDQGQSRHEPEPERPIMSKWFYLTRIGPCGAATGLDIGLGNTSLKYITLTFYTMCKSSSLAFVLLFAFVFRLETPTWRLVGIIATLTLGVVMMVAGEVEFKLGGFLLVISAAFFSGFRWGLTQILLLRNPATSNPFSSIFFLAPVMFVTLLAIAIPSEGFFEMLDGLNTLMGEFGPVLTPMLILFPGTIAFAMTASEFALLQRTSVVTLSIAGIFKEAVTISAAAIVFGDTLTAVNITGLVVTLAAIGAYNWIKISKMRREAQDDVHRGHMDMSEGAPGAFSSSNSTSDADGEDAGEDAGLLRRSNDGEETLFTVDGDLIPKPEGSPGHSDSERRDPHHKASRND
ncbi:TPT-domain-containing protein [Thozetella sp. PMI_491]|nr:TPT-domain-containing protein [Thozetella sp. PMI_491]